MKPELALFYARRDVGGGSTSFTVHLVRAMQLAGIKHTLYRFTENPRAPRMLARYEGITAKYVTPDEARAIVKRQPSLLLAPEVGRKLPDEGLIPELISLGMRLVVHDPNEFKVFDHLNRTLVKRPIAIRPTMKQFFKDAIFIPHPYVRWFANDANAELNWGQRGAACSIARLTFVKRPAFMLEANRLLSKEHQIRFHGMENRLYTHFSVQPKFPEFKQGGYNLPLEWGVSAVAAHGYRFACDFTYFPDDGGGSQYTFMEAWDAGTVNVIHRDWLRYPGEMCHGVNCWAVESSEELAALIKESYTNVKLHKKLHDIACYGEDALVYHNPVVVARRYLKELTR